MMWIKWRIAVLFGIMNALLLTGCGQKSAPEPVQETEMEVEIPVIFRVDPETNLSDNEQFVEDFNEAFAGQFKMEAEWLTESDSGYRSKLKQWNVLDQMPVLITDAGFDYDLYRILAENDRLVDLRPWMESSDFWMDAMNPDVLEDITEEDGSIYLAPLGSNIHTYAGIIYNEELLQSVGYDSFPETWEEFFTCLKKLKAAGITPLSLHGSGSYWAPMLIATAYLMSTEEGSDFLYTGFPDSYDNEAVRDMLLMLKELFEYTYEDALSIDFDQAAERFQNGEAAIIANGKWMFDSMTSENLQTMRFARFPGNVLMNSPRMAAWAVTTGYSEEITEGAAKALEFRIQCEQEDMQKLIDGGASNPLEASYVETVQMEHTVMPNYQLQWEQEIQNEFFTEYLAMYLQGEITVDNFILMMDQRVNVIQNRK